MKHVSIFGAGLAGMVAGIDLARQGHKVTIYDRESAIGGSPDVHPSIHTTPLQPRQTWDYIGIDLSEYFVPTDIYPEFWYDSKRLTLPPYVHNSKAYNVERGPRETSIDRRLFALAQEAGVEFRFGHSLDPDALQAAPAGSIIATGLYKEVYELVGVKYSSTYGYLATIPWDKGGSHGAIHMGRFSVDYGYSAALNGMMFALLFSRTPLHEHDLERFRQVLKDSYGLDFPRWRNFLGYFPRETKLYWNDKILAGTLSGMIEPFWGYGIVGALLSGKVASLAVTDPEQAKQDFQKFSCGFANKLARKEKMDRMPFNKQLLRLAIVKARFDCWRNPKLKQAVKEPMRWFSWIPKE